VIELVDCQFLGFALVWDSIVKYLLLSTFFPNRVRIADAAALCYPPALAGWVIFQTPSNGPSSIGFLLYQRVNESDDAGLTFRYVANVW
jgi:hypothetical protein